MVYLWNLQISERFSLPTNGDTVDGSEIRPTTWYLKIVLLIKGILSILNGAQPRISETSRVVNQLSRFPFYPHFFLVIPLATKKGPPKKPLEVGLQLFLGVISPHLPIYNAIYRGPISAFMTGSRGPPCHNGHNYGHPIPNKGPVWVDFSLDGPEVWKRLTIDWWIVCESWRFPTQTIP